MTHRPPALAAALAVFLSASGLPSPAAAVARPAAAPAQVKAKADKPHKGAYAGATGRKNH